MTNKQSSMNKSQTPETHPTQETPQTQKTPPDLFQLGQEAFEKFLAEFAAYGIEADPGIELRRGTGLLCYYSLTDRHIYLSVPDLAGPTGKLQALFFRSLLGCQSTGELLYFFRLFIPHIIAHELTHHFRQRYGLFGKSLWLEEQVANKLAVAVVKHRLSPEEKTQARNFLRRAINTVARQMAEKNIAADSYYSVLDALNVSGQIDVAQFETLEMLQSSLGVSAEELLEGSGQLSADMEDRLEQRDELIGEIDEQYAADQIKYIYYHLGWLYLDLTSRETEYVDEFARNYLNLGVELLPLLNPPDAQTATIPALQACYRAYQSVIEHHPAAGRYFYKRYRSLLLARLQSARLPAAAQTEHLKREVRLLLESWTETEADTLDYLAQLAPAELRPCFPHLIAQNLSANLRLPQDLPTPTDRRLWQHVVEPAPNAPDDAAANTLHRLSLLDQTDIYRPLPAELQLKLAHKFNLVHFAAGEPVIWQGERNDDVFFLIEGRLEVLVLQNGAPQVVSHVSPGEMFGEIAFFTEDPRYATVRATEPSRCFVLTDADLQLIAYEHPTILMRMAAALAQRLADMYGVSRHETV
ncbi:MAG: cyclic nucleotide-binding domain-containing protein [Chloroflexi bacterium]|nr:MAG: cyclic nucleotide-binding domain-containing protein [Chloroflexota bacterium]